MEIFVGNRSDFTGAKVKCGRIAISFAPNYLVLPPLIWQTEPNAMKKVRLGSDEGHPLGGNDGVSRVDPG